MTSNQTFTASQILRNAGIDFSSQQLAVFSVTVANETSNISSSAFQLQPPLSSGSSGYTLGPVQFDLHSNPSQSQTVIDAVLSAAKVLPNDIQNVNDALDTYASGGRLATLDPNAASIINNALNSSAGQNTLTAASANFFLDNSYNPTISALQKIDVGNLQNGNATDFAANTALVTLMSDTRNQYGTAVNDGLVALLSGKPVSADDAPLNQPQSLVIDNDNPIPYVVQYLLSTDYAVQNISQITRINNNLQILENNDANSLAPGTYYFSTDNSKSNSSINSNIYSLTVSDAGIANVTRLEVATPGESLILNPGKGEIDVAANQDGSLPGMISVDPTGASTVSLFGGTSLGGVSIGGDNASTMQLSTDPSGKILVQYGAGATVTVSQAGAPVIQVARTTINAEQGDTITGGNDGAITLEPD